jgi:hypothetical protein
MAIQQRTEPALGTAQLLVDSAGLVYQAAFATL